MIAVEVSKNQKSFDCATCPARHCDHDRKNPGSIGPASYDMWEVKGVIRSRVCLLPLVNDFSRECLQLYRHYKNGVLIHAGGLYDQPRRYVQAMGSIDACQ